MNVHADEEDKVDDDMEVEEVEELNPHHYLFGGDPGPSHIPEPTLTIPVVIPTPLPEPETPVLRPESPKRELEQKTKPTDVEPRFPVSFKPGNYDERFKTTVDYHQVLTTLVKLKDQREQALLDIKKLESERKKALEDPYRYSKSKQSKGEFLPRRQLPPSIPKVDFSTYQKLPLRNGHSEDGNSAIFTNLGNLPSTTDSHFSTTSKSGTSDGDHAIDLERDSEDDRATRKVNRRKGSKKDLHGHSSLAGHSEDSEHEVNHALGSKGTGMEGTGSQSKQTTSSDFTGSSSAVDIHQTPSLSDTNASHESNPMSASRKGHSGDSSSMDVDEAPLKMEGMRGRNGVGEEGGMSRMEGMETFGTSSSISDQPTTATDQSSDANATIGVSSPRKDSTGMEGVKGQKQRNQNFGSNPSFSSKTSPTHASSSSKVSSSHSTSSSVKAMPHHTPWTLEEQRRLEQLLYEYPDEPVAAYRWEKIARALNRTPKQVVSRIHRYFERLARAGLPVPGRIPETSTPSSRPKHASSSSSSTIASASKASQSLQSSISSQRQSSSSTFTSSSSNALASTAAPSQPFSTLLKATGSDSSNISSSSLPTPANHSNPPRSNTSSNNHTSMLPPKSSSGHQSGGMRNTNNSSSTASHSAPHVSKSHGHWMVEAPSIKMDSVIPQIEEEGLLTESEKKSFSGLETSREYQELIRLKKLKALQDHSHEHYISSEQDVNQEQERLKSNSSFPPPIPPQFVDSDYTLTDDMAYLDPNFMPS